MENVTSYLFLNYTVEDIFVDVYVIGRYSNLSHFFVGLYLSIIAFVGTTANVSIIFLFFTNKSLRNPMNLTFINLAISDLIGASLGALPQCLSTWTRFYMKAGGLFCQLYGLSVFLSGEASLICLAVIAVERYLTVIRPFGMGNLTYFGSLMAILFVWAFALVWAVAPMIGWSRYIPEGLGTWCSIDWSPNSNSNRSYMSLLFIVSYIAPVGLIVFSYFSVWLKVREMAKADSATEGSVKAERTILKMSIIMVGFYLIAWTPYACVGMLGAFGPYGMVTNTVAVFPALFAKASYMYNGIIYIGMNKVFRRALFMMVLGRDPFAKEDQDPSVGGETIGRGNKVAPSAS